MKTQAMTTAMPNMINGMDRDAAMATINAIKADQSLARFQFRARNRWIDGGENRSTIKDFLRWSRGHLA